MLSSLRASIFLVIKYVVHQAQTFCSEVMLSSNYTDYTIWVSSKGPCLEIGDTKGTAFQIHMYVEKSVLATPGFEANSMNSLSENRRLRQAALYFQGGRCSRGAESAGLAARVVRRSHLEGRLSRRWAGIRFASDPASLYSVN